MSHQGNGKTDPEVRALLLELLSEIRLTKRYRARHGNRVVDLLGLILFVVGGAAWIWYIFFRG